MTDLKRLMQFAKNYEDEFAHYMMYCAVEAVNTDRNLMLKELNALYD